MTDSLFLMQRYWGSDDDSDIADTSEKQPSTISPKKKKKKDKTSDVVQTLSVMDDDEQKAAIVQSNDSSPPKKKRKKDKRKSRGDSDAPHNEEQLSTIKENDEEIKNKNNLDNVAYMQNSENTSSKKRKRKFKKERHSDDETSISSVTLEKEEGQVDNPTPELEIQQVTNNVSNTRNNKTKSGKKKTHKIKKELDSIEADRTAYTVLGEVKSQKDTPLQRVLPEWLAKPTIISVNLGGDRHSVSELTYLDDISKTNLSSAGIDYLFPVQQAVVPWLMQCDHRRLSVRPPDLCVSSPTGSGKTLAFVLPIIQSLRNRVVIQTRAVVALPVSDLAMQVFRVFETFCKGSDLKVALLTGKKSFKQEQLSLVQSGTRGLRCLADIVVTTPGKLLDHIRRTPGFTLVHLRYLVIDEADRMMEEVHQGWLRQVELAIFGDTSNRICPPQYAKGISMSSASDFSHVSEPLQKLLLSATLSRDPETLHSLSLYRPKLFSAQNATGTGVANPETLMEFSIVCDASTKPMVVWHLIHERGYNHVLCFVDKMDRAHRLYLILDAMGELTVRELTTNNSPVQRKIALSQFAAGKVNVLVCSDMAARGMDIEGVDCVISYDVPHQIKSHFHRCGRTARAGRIGAALTLLSHSELFHFNNMLKMAGVKIPERNVISNEVLKPYVESYEAALAKANATISREKKDTFWRRSCF